jgi:DNA-binding NarL/FixJ family response regulator
MQASQGLVTMLSEIEGIFVVGTAQSAMQLPGLMEITRPDAVVVDSELPDGMVEGVVGLLKSLDPSPVVIVLAHYASSVLTTSR